MLSFAGSYQVRSDVAEHSLGDVLHSSCGFVGYVQGLVESIALQLQKENS